MRPSEQPSGKKRRRDEGNHYETARHDRRVTIGAFTSLAQSGWNHKQPSNGNPTEERPPQPKIGGTNDRSLVDAPPFARSRPSRKSPPPAGAPRATQAPSPNNSTSMSQGLSDCSQSSPGPINPILPAAGPSSSSNIPIAIEDTSDDDDITSLPERDRIPPRLALPSVNSPVLRFQTRSIPPFRMENPPGSSQVVARKATRPSSNPVIEPPASSRALVRVPTRVERKLSPIDQVVPTTAETMLLVKKAEFEDRRNQRKHERRMAKIKMKADIKEREADRLNDERRTSERQAERAHELELKRLEIQELELRLKLQGDGSTSRSFHVATDPPQSGPSQD